MFDTTKKKNVNRLCATIARFFARVAYWFDGNCDVFVDAIAAYDRRETQKYRHAFSSMFSICLNDDELMRRMKVEKVFYTRSLDAVIEMAVDRFISENPVENNKDMFYDLSIKAREEYFQAALQEHLVA